MSRGVLLAVLVLGAVAAVWLLLGDDDPNAGSLGVLAEDGRSGDALRGTGPGLGDGAGRRGLHVGATNGGRGAGTPGTVTGFVLDHASRKPLAGVTVFLLFGAALGLEDAGEFRTTTTERNGSFRFGKVTPGTWVLYAMHRDYVMFDLREHGGDDWYALSRMAENFCIHAPAQTGMEPRVLTMKPAKGIAGRVVDLDGKPVAGAEILVEVSNSRFAEMLGESPEFPDEHPMAVSGADGSFRLPAIGSHVDEFELTPRKAGHAGYELDVGVNNLPDALELQMEKTCRIAGRLLYDDGEPAEGVSVWISSSLGRSADAVEAMTDAEGFFDAHEVPTDVSELDFYIVDPFLELEDRPIDTLQPGEQRTGLEFRIPKGIAIRGRLVDDLGAPIEGASIDLRRDEAGSNDHGDWESSTDTGKDGTFAIGAKADVRYMLYWDRHDKDVLIARDVEPHADTKTYVMKRQPKKVLLVRVTDAEGEPVPRFVVQGEGRARDWEDDDVRTHHTPVEGRKGEARLELSGAPPWKILVQGARAENGMRLDAAISQVSLDELPDEPLEIQLLPGGSVPIAIDDEDENPVAGSAISVAPGFGTVRTTAPGRFVLENVPRLVHEVSLQITLPKEYVQFYDTPCPIDGDELRITARRALTVRGRVLPEKSLSPGSVEKIVLSVEWNNDLAHEVDEVQVSPAADGSFEITGVPADADVWIGASSLPEDLYLRKTVKCRAGAEDVSVPLKAGAAMTVMVRRAGEPTDNAVNVILRDARDRARGEDSYTESLGESSSVTFRGIRPGDYDVFLTIGEHGSLARKRDVPAGSTVTLTLPSAGVIKGRVEQVPPNHHVYVRVVSDLDADTPMWWSNWPAFNDSEETAAVPFEKSGFATGRAHSVYVAVVDQDSHDTIGVAVISGVIPGGPPVVINHDPVGALSGQVRLPEGRRGSFYVVARAKGISYGGEVSSNQFHIGYLAQGRYEVVLTDAKGKVYARLPSVRTGSEGILLVAEGAAPEDD